MLDGSVGNDEQSLTSFLISFICGKVAVYLSCILLNLLAQIDSGRK